MLALKRAVLKKTKALSSSLLKSVLHHEEVVDMFSCSCSLSHLRRGFKVLNLSARFRGVLYRSCQNDSPPSVHLRRLPTLKLIVFCSRCDIHITLDLPRSTKILGEEEFQGIPSALLAWIGHRKLWSCLRERYFRCSLLVKIPYDGLTKDAWRQCFEKLVVLKYSSIEIR